MLKLNALFITMSLTAACAAPIAPTGPGRLVVNLKPSDLGYEKSRELALQYLSKVSWYDYEGGPISVSRCEESMGCDFLVSHTGNGCGWASRVEEVCRNGECTYSFTKYNEEALCE